MSVDTTTALYCNLCDETKPITEFFKRNTRPRGYDYACKQCSSKRRNSYPIVKAYNITGNDPNSHKRKARTALNNALKGKKLTRPDVCSACNVEGKIQGHHPDYSKPLYVIWLCSMCHFKLHKGELSYAN